MAKTDITKQAGTVVSPQRDIFAAMRDEMDKMFERFEHGFPRWPALFRRASGNGIVVPELDVRENATSMTVEAELPGVDEKDISVTLANGVLTIKGEKQQRKEEKNESFYLAERSYVMTTLSPCPSGRGARLMPTGWTGKTASRGRGAAAANDGSRRWAYL